MYSIKKNFLILFLTFSLLNFNNLFSEEKVEAIIDQIQIISKDLKTLEKAFYKNSDIVEKNKSSNVNNLNEDVLTKHLLRLNEIEEQFRELTNKFEEVNFKMDKLSSRITKMQSDNQMRFSDLENTDLNQNKNKKKLNFQEQVNLKILERRQDIRQKIYLKNKKQFRWELLQQSPLRRQKDQSLYFQTSLQKNNMTLQLVL